MSLLVDDTTLAERGTLVEEDSQALPVNPLRNQVSESTVPPAALAVHKRLAGLRVKLVVLGVIVALCALGFQFIDVNMKYFDYAMSIRLPKLAVILVVAFCIGAATIVFQSVIGNRIITPCLLGMNSLYSMIHTSVVFVAGSGSVIAMNKNLAFGVDLVIMGIVATLLYSYLFRKTKYNVLYVLLAGTVLTSLFGSATNAMIRVMDPNEYLTLQNSLIASFNSPNSSVTVMGVVVVAVVVFALRHEVAKLDVVALGRTQAINLGVDYDRTIQRLLLGVTLLIAVATAMVGPISFLGLIIANLARQLFQTHRHTYLISGSVLVGMAVLLGGQTILEHLFSFNSTIAVFVNVGGGLYFLYLLLRQPKGL
jgi:iron complex transport system permease protein